MQQNAIAALLDEYKKAMLELIDCIATIDDATLTAVVNPQTNNPDCVSIQTILTHVVSAGYSYCVYILNLKDPNINRPEKHLRNAAVDYKEDLEKVWTFTTQTFANIYDTEIEETDNAKKIHTAWGQLYDIEQLMEHAIVHILRHRRQIEKYKILLKG